MFVRTKAPVLVEPGAISSFAPLSRNTDPSFVNPEAVSSEAPWSSERIPLLLVRASALLLPVAPASAMKAAVPSMERDAVFAI